MYKLKTLYIVGKNVPTSIPLEVADAISRRKIDISIVAFKDRSNRRAADVDSIVKEVKAKSIYDLSGVWRLYKYVTEVQPDVAHVHHTASSFWAAILAKLVSNAAVIRTEHNNQRHYSVGQNIVGGCVQALSDRILCNSNDTYDNLYSFQKWLVGDDWETVYNGVNIDRIEKASGRPSPFSEEVPSNRTMIGSVGRLVDQKNYGRLIQAFSLVAEEISGLHLVIVGDGENKRVLKEKARAEGIDDRITITGELSRDQVYAALHQFDLFVMPSLWEGFCNSVVEAMAAGNPVVCSDISTLREVAGDAALYADPTNSAAMADTLTELLMMDSVTRKKWGEKAWERATGRFTIDRTAEKYVEAYHEVANVRVS